MNYDRLLTRVWDKQEKKMIYPEDYIGTIEYKHTGTVKHAEFVAIQGDSMWIKYDDYEGDCFREVGLDNKGRFVPMMCLGKKDKEQKLIYQSDIIKMENELYEVIVNEDIGAFGFLSLKNTDNLFVPTVLFRKDAEIIGNRWENENLLEVKE